MRDDDLDFIDTMQEDVVLIRKPGNEERLISLMEYLDPKDELSGVALCLMVISCRTQQYLGSPRFVYFGNKILKKYYRGAMNFIITWRGMEMKEVNDIEFPDITVDSCSYYHHGGISTECKDCNAADLCSRTIFERTE